MVKPSERVFEVVAQLSIKTFSEKQLQAIYLLKDFEHKENITNAKFQICRKIGISESTLRRTINYLRKNEFLVCGDSESKGSPIQFTESGNVLVRGCSVALTQRSPKPQMGVQLQASAIKHFLPQQSCSSCRKVAPAPLNIQCRVMK